MTIKIPCLCNNDNINSNLKTYLELQGCEMLLVNPQNFIPDDVLIICEPYLIQGDSYSVHRFWRRYLYYKSSNTKLIVCGYDVSKHPNYLSLINRPKVLTNFIKKAKRISDYKVNKNEISTDFGIKYKYKDTWDTAFKAIRGVDFIDKRYNVFFDGHDEMSSLIWKLTQINRRININQHQLTNKKRAYKEIREEILEDYNEVWSGFFERWKQYNKHYFIELPIYQEIQQIDRYIQNLENFCKAIPLKESDYFDFNPQNSTQQIKLELKQLERYADNNFGKGLPTNHLEAYLEIDDDFEDEKLANRKNKPLILLVENEISHIENFKEAFGEYYKIRVTKDEKHTLKILEDIAAFELIALDLDLVGDSNYERGIQFIPEVKKRTNASIIVVTGDRQDSTGIEAMKAGANDFLKKADFNVRIWIKKFEEAIGKRQLVKKVKHLEVENKILKRQNANLKAQIVPFITKSPKMETIKKRLKILAAKPNTRVLITGETGVGKDVAARYYYQCSERFGKPFIAENLAGTSKEMLESKLFGFKKGAFTDAKADHDGIFKRADKGVLFLDEIGEIDPEIQVKLLRVIEDKQITPLGSSRSSKVDIQIITATNLDLLAAIKEGKFRKDLYQRLKGHLIEIPPLRERREDIIPIMLHYLNISENELYQIMDENVVEYLISYNWPYNVRELRDTIEVMKVNQEVEELNKITFECLPNEIKENATTTIDNENLSAGEALALEKAQIELKRIDKALAKAKGHRGDAAKILNMKSSDDIRYRIKKYIKEYSNLVQQYPNIYKAYKNYF